MQAKSQPNHNFNTTSQTGMKTTHAGTNTTTVGHTYVDNTSAAAGVGGASGSGSGVDVMWSTQQHQQLKVSCARVVGAFCPHATCVHVAHACALYANRTHQSHTIIMHSKPHYTFSITPPPFSYTGPTQNVVSHDEGQTST